MNLIKLFLLLFFTIFLSANEQKLQKVSLQLQWKHQFEFAGFYAAKEKGFYRDAGLDVEFIEYEKTKNITDIVLHGNSEYGLSYSSVIAEYMEGKPLILLANFFKQSPLVLITQEDINTPTNLKGKKVMGVSDSIDNMTLVLMLNKFGVKTQDIINIPTTFDLDDFINKKVDAMSVFTTNELYYLDKKGIKYNIFDPVVYGAKYYDVNLFTSKKELINYPLRVQKFKEASIKGWKYALENKDEVIDVILEKYNTQNKSKEALLFEAKQIEQIMLPNVYEIGSIDKNRVQIIADSFIQAGFIKNIENKNIESFIYNDIKKPLILTAKEKKFLLKHPKIILGTEKRWEPYVLVSESGEISGYDADVLALINEVSGANFSLVAGDWAVMQEGAKKREIDGLSTGGIHEERKSYLNFSDVYIEMQKMLIVSKENPNDIHTLDDLEDKIIAIHKSNLVDEKMARKFTKSQILRLETIEDVISSVITAKADVMFGNGSTFYLANKIGMPYLKREAKLKESLKLAFGVRKDWPQAISIINKSLNYIGKHKLLELKNKWFFKQNRIQESHFTNDEMIYLKNKKDITICVDPDWMPYEAIVNNKYVGMGADFLKYFNKELDIKIKVMQTKTWSESMEALKRKKCDILSLSVQTKERTKYLNFTSAYLQANLVIATKSEIPSVIDISFIEYEKIAVVKEYAIVDIIKSKYPNLEVVEVDNIEEGFKKVENGEVFGFADTSAAIDYYFKNHSFDEFKISAYFDEKLFLGLGVRSDDIELYSILQKVVSKITNEQKQAIMKKWLSEKYKKEFDYTLFYQLFSVVFIILIFVLIGHFSIKKSNIILHRRVQEELEKSRDKDKVLYHQNKLAAMGEMLENIAHQWRQPLSQINSSVLLIDNVLHENNFTNAEIEERLLEIESLTKYLSNTIDDFKDFFHEDKQMRTFIVKDMIERSLSIVKGSFAKDGIKMEMDVEDGLECISYENELQQVLVVILNNAKDALVDRNIHNALVKITVKFQDGFYIIEICDNAGGIRKNAKDKIFDPYFTTKHKSQGTGLGLYMSKKIIEESLDGELSVKNSKKGSCFEIKLGVNIA